MSLHKDNISVDCVQLYGPDDEDEDEDEPEDPRQ